MDKPVQTKHNRGFTFILSLFTLIYPLGVIFLLLAWLGIQSYAPLPWQQNTLPIYALVFLIGCASVYGIWRRKKWGVYGLAAAWVLADGVGSWGGPRTVGPLGTWTPCPDVYAIPKMRRF